MLKIISSKQVLVKMYKLPGNDTSNNDGCFSSVKKTMLVISISSIIVKSLIGTSFHSLIGIKVNAHINNIVFKLVRQMRKLK